MNVDAVEWTPRTAAQQELYNELLSKSKELDELLNVELIYRLCGRKTPLRLKVKIIFKRWRLNRMARRLFL